MRPGRWASESPNPLTRRHPLRFRFHVAMAGALGISGNLRQWTDQERREVAALVAACKKIRHVIQHGFLHRLTSAKVEGPLPSSTSATTPQRLGCSRGDRCPGTASMTRRCG